MDPTVFSKKLHDVSVALSNIFKMNAPKGVTVLMETVPVPKGDVPSSIRYRLGGRATAGVKIYPPVTTATRFCIFGNPPMITSDVLSVTLYYSEDESKPPVLLQYSGDRAEELLTASIYEFLMHGTVPPQDTSPTYH